MDEKANLEVDSPKTKKVLVFGTFDGIHEGHIHFLTEASKLGDLYVSIATDVATKILKDHLPRRDERERERDVENLKIAKAVYIGEQKIENWKTLKLIRPDIVVLGYDQSRLKEVLTPLSKELGFEIKIMKAFEPEKYHSRFLNPN